MPTSAFRYHDDVPPEITSPYYARLIQEWVGLNSYPRTANTVRSWAATEPALVGCGRPGDVVDAIDAAPSGGKDAILLALIRLTQGGDQLAGAHERENGYKEDHWQPGYESRQVPGIVIIRLNLYIYFVLHKGWNQIRVCRS